MDRLLQIGFRDIGHWTLVGQGLELRLDTLPSHRRALYAFATSTSVLYVGKTAGALPTRLKAYITPHQSQRTNARNRAAILELLRAGTNVRILGWIDPGLHRIGPFDLNMAAGLEDSIIALLAPPWNGARTAPICEVPSYSSLPAPSITTPLTLPIASIPSELRRVVVPGAPSTPESGTAARISSAVSNAGSHAAGTTFKVRLGKTYYERGFFNVPVAFSKLFGNHGATVKLYCGNERALVDAILDRKANQQNGTPRIYGKGELASWLQRRFQLNDMLTVTALSPTSALLM